MSATAVVFWQLRGPSAGQTADAAMAEPTARPALTIRDRDNILRPATELKLAILPAGISQRATGETRTVQDIPFPMAGLSLKYILLARRSLVRSLIKIDRPCHGVIGTGLAQ